MRNCCSRRPSPSFRWTGRRDGRFLLYDSLDPKRGSDIWALPLEGDRKPFEVVQTDFNERLAQFSPDGTWIAYQSDKTGRFEIYVQPFPGPGGDSRVSIDGGAQVRWNPNGKELFYIAADDRLMAVPIRFVSDGKAVEPRTPLGLFATNVGSTAVHTNRQQYVVSPDGQSFVMNSVAGRSQRLAHHGHPQLEAETFKIGEQPPREHHHHAATPYRFNSSSRLNQRAIWF